MNFAFEVERPSPPTRRTSARKTAESDYERGRRAWEEHNERSKQRDPDAEPLDAPQFQEGSEEFKAGWMDAAEGMTREEREHDVAETDRILDEIARGDREVREARKQAEYDEDEDYEDEGGYPPATGTKCPECGAEDWQRGFTRDAECGMCGATFDVDAEGEVGRRIGVPPFFEKAGVRKTAEHSCPDCGSTMSIDGENDQVESARCPNCGTERVFKKKSDKVKEHSMDRSSLRQREADILAAMANANLQERRKLAQELNDVQRQRREAIQAERDVDLADTVIRDHLTPVMAHSRSTEDTDWLGEVGLTTEAARDDVHRQMTAEATMWFRNLHEAVIADEEEFAEQAKGKARRVASSYDLIRDEATQAFLDQAAHLRRKAEVDWDGSTGEGAADVADVPTPGQEVADYPQPNTSESPNTDEEFGDDDEGSKESAKTAEEGLCNKTRTEGAGETWYCSEEKGHDGPHIFDRKKQSAKTAGETVKWSGELPDCDICKTEFTSSTPNKAQFDGKTAMGPWAYMCKEHFQALGVGLGTGYGQRLIKEEARKVADAGVCPSCGATMKKQGDQAVCPQCSYSEDYGRPLAKRRRQGDMNPPSDDLVDTDIDRYYGDPEGVEGPSTDSQSGFGETQAPVDTDEEPAFDDASFDEDPPKEKANQATSPPPGESSRDNNFQPSYSRRRTAEEQKWVAEVTGQGEDRWSRNALVFDTKEEAQEWLDGLSMRWFGYDMGRVVPADTPRNQSVSETGTEGIYQNFRSASLRQAAVPDDLAEMDPDELDEYLEALDRQEQDMGPEPRRPQSSRKTAARALHEIAREIEREWDNVSPAARPYLDAMKTLDSITDNYMYDSAKSIVLYFLSNARSFQGDKAREIKAELKGMLKNAARTAAEGKTCQVCGDPIEKDPSSEDPQTWHHDSGTKHDHEAKPASSDKESVKVADLATNCERCGKELTVFDALMKYPVCKDCVKARHDEATGKQSSRRVARESLCDSCGKRKEDVSVAYGPDGGMLDLCDSCLSSNEDYSGYTRTKQSSRRTAGVYCKTHDVWVGEGNADTHEGCSKEQRKTEKTKESGLLQVTDPKRFEAFARRLRASS